MMVSDEEVIYGPCQTLLHMWSDLAQGNDILLLDLTGLMVKTCALWLFNIAKKNDPFIDDFPS